MLLVTAPILASLFPALAAQSTGVVATSHDGRPVPIVAGSRAALSDDARWVVFTTSAGDVVVGQTTTNTQAYRQDRMTAAVVLVSLSDGGVPADGVNIDPQVSDDGSLVAFLSTATNLDPPTNGALWHLYLRDHASGQMEMIDVDPVGAPAAGSAEGFALAGSGDHVVFTSLANDVVAGDLWPGRDVFLRDRVAGTTELISLSTSSVQADGESWVFSTRAISDDGRYVVFSSNGASLDLNGPPYAYDAFLRDRTAGTTTVLSVDAGGTQANDHSYGGSLSGDGRYVVFWSSGSNLVAGDTNGVADVFLRDLTAGIIERVSVDSGGIEGNGASSGGFTSASGRLVVFASQATDLSFLDTMNDVDVFVRDRSLGTTALVSRATNGFASGGNASAIAISDDGRQVLFGSPGNLLVSGLPGGVFRAYVHDRQANAPVSVYCTPKTNSAGCVPQILAADLPYLDTFDGFVVSARPVLSDKLGIFFWGRAQASLPFGGGTLCVQPPVERTPVQDAGHAGTSGPCAGAYSYHFTGAYMDAEGVLAGDTLYGQFWSRDPGFAPPDNIGLSDAVSFTVVP